MSLWAVNIGQNFWLNKPGVGITQQAQQCVWLPLPPGHPGVPAGVPICKDCFASIGDLISCILPNIYVFAGVILFVLMIVGGIGVIKSANGGNEEDLKKGQQAITSALIGFLLIFVSYWIIQLVQIITGVQIFTTTL
jgi:hypothetical protein